MSLGGWRVKERLLTCVSRVTTLLQVYDKVNPAGSASLQHLTIKYRAAARGYELSIDVNWQYSGGRDDVSFVRS